jgi:tetratricopeptide (TPR) repeat protein
MAVYFISLDRLQAAACAAVLSAAALTGCSTTKLAVKDQQPQPAKYGSTPPSTNTVLTPGSPEFASGEAVKHPERIHLAYGRWQEQQRQPALARESYQKVLDHDPKSVEALLGLARLDQLAGRPADAEQRLIKAQQLQPQSALISAAWGEFYSSQHNWPRAIERYRQAISLAPDEALYKHQLAVALVKSGAVNDGLSGFVALVGQAEAHYNVGVLLHQQGRSVEAEQHLQRALVLKPELTPASTMIVKIQRERGLAPIAATNQAAPPSRPELASPSVAAPASPQVAVSNPLPETQPPNNAVTAATWTAAKSSTVQPANYSPASGSSPQQAEQWRNQSAPR